MRPRRLFAALSIAVFVLLPLSGTVAAQEIRVDAGAGWALPTGEVDMETTIVVEQASAVDTLSGLLPVDLGSGPNVYGAIGFVRSIGDNFALGARLRGQLSRMDGDAEDVTSQIGGCAEQECSIPGGLQGRLWAGTVEGRIILTATGRIHPYLLVGLGVVHTTVDGGAIEAGSAEPPRLNEGTVEEVMVTDAGGDLGLGASLQIVGGLYLDGEVRVTGSLPGGRENAVTTFPFTLGLSYGF